MDVIPKRYIPESSNDDNSVLIHLLDKSWDYTTWKQHNNQSIKNKEPLNQQLIRDMTSTILGNFNCNINYIEVDGEQRFKGAFFDLEDFFLFNYKHYIELGVINPAQEDIFFKISWDGTNFKKKASEGFWMVPTMVRRAQSEHHCWEFCRIGYKESNEVLSIVAKETQLEDFFFKYQKKQIQDKVINFFISGDWQALVKFYDCPPANGPDDSQCCLFCDATKHEQIIGYQENDTILFINRTANNWPQKAANIPLEYVFYDPLHGFSRMMVRLFYHLYHLVDKGKKKHFKALLAKFMSSSYGVQYTFNPDDVKASMELLKKIFKKNETFEIFLKGLIQLYDNLRPEHIKLNGLEVILTLKQAVLMVEDSHKIFFDFIYLKSPTDVARTGILGFYAHFKLDLMPAVHYMLFHMFEKLYYFGEPTKKLRTPQYLNYVTLSDWYQNNYKPF